MTTAEIFTFICATAALVATICSIFAFYITRKKESYSKGSDDTWLKAAIADVKNSLDELRLDVKGYARKQNEMSEQQVRFDELLKSHDKRIDLLEKQTLRKSNSKGE